MLKRGEEKISGNRQLFFSASHLQKKQQQKRQDDINLFTRFLITNKEYRDPMYIQLQNAWGQEVITDDELKDFITTDLIPQYERNGTLDIILAKARIPQNYKGLLNGTAYQFAEQNAHGVSNYWFDALNETKESIITELLLWQEDTDARAMLAQEIQRAVLDKSFIIRLPENSPISRSDFQNKVFYKAYLEQCRTHPALLGYESAKLYARIKKFNFIVWEETSTSTEEKPSLQIKYQFSIADATQTFHIRYSPHYLEFFQLQATPIAEHQANSSLKMR